MDQGVTDYCMDMKISSHLKALKINTYINAKLIPQNMLWIPLVRLSIIRAHGYWIEIIFFLECRLIQFDPLTK